MKRATLQGAACLALLTVAGCARAPAPLASWYGGLFGGPDVVAPSETVIAPDVDVVRLDDVDAGVAPGDRAVDADHLSPGRLAAIAEAALDAAADEVADAEAPETDPTVEDPGSEDTAGVETADAGADPALEVDEGFEGVLFVRTDEEPLDGPPRRSGEFDASHLFIEDGMAPIADFDPFERPDAPAVEALSLSEMFRSVLETNTDIRIAATLEEVRGYDVDLAEAQYSATVDLELIALGEFNDTEAEREEPTETGEAVVTINYRIYDFGARDYDAGRARSAAEQASAELRSVAEQTFEGVALSLLGVLEADAVLAEMDANIARLEELAELVTLKHDQGAATVADVEQVASRLEAALTARSQLVTNRDTALNAFERLVGLPLEVVASGGLLRLPTIVDDFDIVSVQHNPDVQALGHRIEALRRTLRALERGRLPTVDLELLGGISGIDDTEYGRSVTGSVGVTVSQRLWDGGVDQIRISQTLAQIQEAELRRASVMRELVEEAQNTQRTADAAEEVARSLAEQVSSLTQVSSLYVDQFAAGQRSLFELLEADAQLLEARVQELSHRYSRIRTALTQLRLAGGLVQVMLAADDWAE